MPRTLLLLAILGFSAGPMHGRTTTERDLRRLSTESKPRVTQRVLFRTNAPPLIPTVRPKTGGPQVIPVRREQEKKRPLELPPAAKPRPVSPPRIAPVVPTPTLPRALELQPTTFTPYDPYLGSVRSAIAQLDARGATMVTACDLMREGHGFRYKMTDPYRAQPPKVTEARRAGDCKSKALWLYDQLGDTGAYYTIGKLQRASRTSHAWVYWRHDGRWWILDPTDRATPIAADSVSSSRYVPYYSYSRAGTFRHPATRLMLAMGDGFPAASAVAVRARAEGVKGTARESQR